MRTAKQIQSEIDNAERRLRELAEGWERLDLEHRQAHAMMQAEVRSIEQMQQLFDNVPEPKSTAHSIRNLRDKLRASLPNLQGLAQQEQTKNAIKIEAEKLLLEKTQVERRLETLRGELSDAQAQETEISTTQSATISYLDTPLSSKPTSVHAKKKRGKKNREAGNLPKEKKKSAYLRKLQESYDILRNEGWNIKNTSYQSKIDDAELELERIKKELSGMTDKSNDFQARGNINRVKNTIRYYTQQEEEIQRRRSTYEDDLAAALQRIRDYEESADLAEREHEREMAEIELQKKLAELEIAKVNAGATKAAVDANTNSMDKLIGGILSDGQSKN